MKNVKPLSSQDPKTFQMQILLAPKVPITFAKHGARLLQMRRPGIQLPGDRDHRGDLRPVLGDLQDARKLLEDNWKDRPIDVKLRNMVMLFFIPPSLKSLSIHIAKEGTVMQTVWIVLPYLMHVLVKAMNLLPLAVHSPLRENSRGGFLDPMRPGPQTCRAQRNLKRFVALDRVRAHFHFGKMLCQTVLGRVVRSNAENSKRSATKLLGVHLPRLLGNLANSIPVEILNTLTILIKGTSSRAFLSNGFMRKDVTCALLLASIGFRRRLKFVVGGKLLSMVARLRRRRTLKLILIGT